MISLDARTVEILRRCLEIRSLEHAVEGWSDTCFLFVDDWHKRAGQGVHPSRVRLRLGELLAQAGLRKVNVHDLRHAAATQMLANGVPVKVVSERLGHANTSITLNLYGHTIPGQDAAAAATVAAAIDGDG